MAWRFRRAHLALLLAAAASASALQQLQLSRRQATVAIAVPLAVSRISIAGASETYELLLRARSQLEPCSSLIIEGSWDRVRTIVKTAPLQNVKNIATKRMGELGEAGEDLVVPREAFVQALQMLDMGVYNNNFVSEQNGQGKRGAGVKIDRETPLLHLREAKEALDEMLAIGA
uniref:Uncharacterized protein n=1 Tax=Calcidiscus leptoporus TaxID=127549 RepID=A0A7S0NUS4_9EUKA